MGILEQLAADMAEVKSMLAALGGAAGTTGGAAGGKGETAAQKKAREKAEAEAAKPKFTAEELRDKFLEVMKVHGEPAAKALIADCGYDKLAKLVADAPNWQKSWDAAVAKLAEAPEEDDDGGL